VEENGGIYYYVDGKLTYAGLIEVNGDYYYVNSSCKVITGQKYWISKTNGLKAEKSYTFDETGKMILG
jgi:glucan-binding YG repeat protein